MKRIEIAPRPNWPDIVTSQGLTYHTATNGLTYWNEAAYYQFSSDEIDVIDAATKELHRLCMEAVRHVIENDLLGHIGLPEVVHDAIRWSWSMRERSIYGRFDFAYDGVNPPKLLEYNADTPTTLVEGAVAQWYWMQERFPEADQFNSIWEGLVEAWTALKVDNALKDDVLYFASGDNEEDWMTITMLRDTAQEAGIKTAEIFMPQIGWDGARKAFVDEADRPIKSIFKLYPWEWLIKDQFGRYALETYKDVQWIEPIWRFVLSCKGILAVLWELFPDHPNLAECYMDDAHGMREYVSKPVISREGANVTLHTSAGELSTAGRYGDYRRVCQQICSIPNFDGNYAVIGSWVINGKPHGMGVRESDGMVTINLSRFVPHLIG